MLIRLNRGADQWLQQSVYSVGPYLEVYPTAIRFALVLPIASILRSGQMLECFVKAWLKWIIKEYYNGVILTGEEGERLVGGPC